MPTGAMPSTHTEHAGPTGPAHRIVVGVDGSEHADAALDWAARQAGLTGAELEVLTTFGPEYVFVTPLEEQQATDEVLEGAARRVRRVAPETTVTGRARRGWADQVLVEESAGAELLVVGSRGLGGFRGLLLGSVGRKCAHRSTVPVVVVHGPPDGEGPGGTDVPPGGAMGDAPAHRIVVGADGSPSSAAALAWAADQASMTGALLEVVMSWDWPTMYGWSPGPLEYDPQEDCETQLEQAVGPIRDGHPEITIQAVAIQGAPAPLLVKASSGADLLAVGSRGRREATDLLLGSVSEHCVVHAHCPVLVHHTPA